MALRRRSARERYQKGGGSASLSAPRRPLSKAWRYIFVRSPAHLSARGRSPFILPFYSTTQATSIPFGFASSFNPRETRNGISAKQPRNRSGPLLVEESVLSVSKIAESVGCARFVSGDSTEAMTSGSE